MRQLSARSLAAAVLVPALSTPALATWSICIGDCETREVAVGTVTCLNQFDLLAIVPVVVVEKGTAAVQSAGDFAGIRRPIIFDGLMLGLSPQEIFERLEDISGHQSRQYGIVDTQCRGITFSGSNNGAWAGGLTGQVGSMFYAVQGNVLAGACVVDAIEAALISTFNEGGDMPDMLMAGMRAAYLQGGDGRCSCSPGNPPGCGCPVKEFDKSGHIGGMIVARVGDEDDPVCSASGCADGVYFMRLNVAFQSDERPDPVEQLEGLFDEWRTERVGLTDAIRSTVAFDPPLIPPNGVATTTMEITLLDWRDLPIEVDIASVTVEHTEDSAGLSTIGAVQDVGGGRYEVTLTAGAQPGLDRFRVVVEEQPSERLVWLMPEPSFEYFELGDLDGDGAVDFSDLLALLAQWGPCPEPPAGCPGDLDGDGDVDFQDLLLLLANWT